MTDPNQPPASDWHDLAVDMVALVLILAGLGGLITVAFLLDPLVGAAVVSMLAFGGGLLLARRQG